MIERSVIAQLCADIYVSSDGWAHYWQLDEVVCAHKVVDGSDVIVLRGSKSVVDWIRDAESWPWWHENLGFCHHGFLSGMDEVFAAVRAVVKGPVTIGGHSLGGARARILAAMFAYNKLPVEYLCVFGSPKPGFANVSRIIQKSGMVHESYRNRNDPIPLVAAILPFWVHPEDWIAVSGAPAIDDLEPLRDHHISRYLQGLSNLAGAPVVTPPALLALDPAHPTVLPSLVATK